MRDKRLRVGRNESCPCGSDRKYKKCCLQRPSPEFVHKINEQILYATAKEHEEFLTAHAHNTCYLCGLLYEQYDLMKPCAHWLLRPSNIKKDALVSIFKEQGCFQPLAFLRWLANTESFGTQINDWSDESDESKVFETTIKYKNYEWSFTCSAGDFAGHKKSTVGANSHFHFQMRINGISFIDYGDYHLRFTQRDLEILNIQQNKTPGIMYKEIFGPGINQILNETVNNKLDGMKVAEDETSAQFHMATILEATPGTSISGDEIADIIEESKLTGVPMAILFRRLKNVSISTTVEPGPGVIEKAVRTLRKRGRAKSI